MQAWTHKVSRARLQRWAPLVPTRSVISPRIAESRHLFGYVPQPPHQQINLQSVHLSLQPCTGLEGVKLTIEFSEQCLQLRNREMPPQNFHTLDFRLTHLNLLHHPSAHILLRSRGSAFGENVLLHQPPVSIHLHLSDEPPCAPISENKLKNGIVTVPDSVRLRIGRFKISPLLHHPIHILATEHAPVLPHGPSHIRGGVRRQKIREERHAPRRDEVWNQLGDRELAQSNHPGAVGHRNYPRNTIIPILQKMSRRLIVHGKVLLGCLQLAHINPDPISIKNLDIPEDMETAGLLGYVRDQVFAGGGGGHNRAAGDVFRLCYCRPIGVGSIGVGRKVNRIKDSNCSANVMGGMAEIENH